MTTLLLKRSSVAGKQPTALQSGEFAYNQADGLLYWLDNNGALQSTELFAAPVDALVGNNLIFNGGMEVSQFNGSNSVSPSASTYVVDQFKAWFSNTGATFAAQQIAPPGSPPFGKTLPQCLQLKATAAVGALAAADFVLLRAPIEGYRWGRLGYGAASAAGFTLGYWLYADVAGTITVSVQNATATRTYLQDVVVASGWNWLTQYIPGDTLGTWAADSTLGATISWCFGSGSNWRGVAGWNAGNYFGTTNTTNLFGSNNNRICLTGVVAIPGKHNLPSSHGAFMIAPFDEELHKAKRYWRSSYDYGLLPQNIGYDGVSFVFMNGMSSASYAAGQSVDFGSDGMRQPPVVIGYSPHDGTPGYAYDANLSANVPVSISYIGTAGFRWYASTLAAETGVNLVLHWSADARL